GHFAHQDVAHGQYCGRNSASAKRNAVPENVADGERSTTDERNRNSSTKSNDVVDVADVALARGNGSEAAADDDLDLIPPPDAICAECQLRYGMLEPRRVNGRVEWLHSECLVIEAAPPRGRRAQPNSGDSLTAHKRATEQ